MINFSIITTTLNAGDALCKTLDSVLAQTYDSSLIEMILVDGASTDETISIIKEYETRFQFRMKWISEPDESIYIAFNKGISMATGDVLNFKGAGDWLENDALEKVAQIFNNEPKTDMVVSLLNEWEPSPKLRYKQTIFKDPKKLLVHYWCMHQSYFYRRQIHDVFGTYPTEYRVVGDLAFFAELIKNNSLCIRNIYLPLANFVLDGISTQEEIRSYEVRKVKSIYGPEIKTKKYIGIPFNFIRSLKQLVKFVLPYGFVNLLIKSKKSKK